MESLLPGAGQDDRRRGPSEVARRQHRPSPGAARRPLPGRERRLFSAVKLRCANRHSVAPSDVDSSPSPWLGRGRGWKVREWVERRCTTQPTLTRRCAPASPWEGEASLCCCVANRRQHSVHSLHRANPSPADIGGRGRTRCRGGSRTAPTTPHGVALEPAVKCRDGLRVPGGTAPPRTGDGGGTGGKAKKEAGPSGMLGPAFLCR